MMPAIPKPAGPIKNKGAKAYASWLQNVLLPLWWNQKDMAGKMYVMEDGYACHMIECALCGAKGLVGKEYTGKKFKLIGLDVGHIEGRGRRPDLKMSVFNVRPECRICNSRLTRGE